MTEQTTSPQPPNNQPRPKLYSEGFQFVEFSGFLALLFPVTLLVLGAIEGLGILWRPLGGVLYFFLLVFSAIILMGVGVSKDDEIGKLGQEEVAVVMTTIFGLIMLVSFSQISRYLYLAFGGFVVSQSGYWHWIRFGVSNVLESVLFDIPAIYNWHVSEIEANAFWSQTLVLIFRTSLEFMVVNQVIRAIGFARKTWKNSTHSLHSNYWGFLFSNLGKFILLGIWSIPLSICIGAIVNDGLSLASATNAFKSTFPILIALWFTWQNLRAFFSIKGGWNKFLALLGIVLGSWLVNQNWSIFKSLIGF